MGYVEDGAADGGSSRQERVSFAFSFNGGK